MQVKSASGATFWTEEKWSRKFTKYFTLHFIVVGAAYNKSRSTPELRAHERDGRNSFLIFPMPFNGPNLTFVIGKVLIYSFCESSERVSS